MHESNVILDASVLDRFADGSVDDRHFIYNQVPVCMNIGSAPDF